MPPRHTRQASDINGSMPPVARRPPPAVQPARRHPFHTCPASRCGPPPVLPPHRAAQKTGSGMAARNGRRAGRRAAGRAAGGGRRAADGGRQEAGGGWRCVMTHAVTSLMIASEFQKIDARHRVGNSSRSQSRRFLVFSSKNEVALGKGRAISGSCNLICAPEQSGSTTAVLPQSAKQLSPELECEKLVLK
ncbi:hypothetical protein GGX14DRAFT_645025 [Mycena pura]|uniref:Uncharacterized protein n=1 Tax=Mycena pura TaxID=153505 RepID=A0AAD6VBK8_9AGAR|nr:hypothetical protein GGX14DRAFT_645025 [Mycena pura]